VEPKKTKVKPRTHGLTYEVGLLKGSMKYNVDGSWMKEQREGVMPEICNNEESILIDGFT